jgi:hypothetical protein
MTSSEAVRLRPATSSSVKRATPHAEPRSVSIYERTLETDKSHAARCRAREDRTSEPHASVAPSKPANAQRAPQRHASARALPSSPWDPLGRLVVADAGVDQSEGTDGGAPRRLINARSEKLLANKQRVPIALRERPRPPPAPEERPAGPLSGKQFHAFLTRQAESVSVRQKNIEEGEKPPVIGSHLNKKSSQLARSAQHRHTELAVASDGCAGDGDGTGECDTAPGLKWASPHPWSPEAEARAHAAVPRDRRLRRQPSPPTPTAQLGGAAIVVKARELFKPMNRLYSPTSE